MKKVAYYKGCLASLSAKELDISTRALAPKVGYELIELESVTCCGAGDIHEAEPDYYLHLNARILAYAEATGVRHADDGVQRLHAQPAAGELPAQDRRGSARARQRQPREGRRAALRRPTSRCMHFLWLVAGESFDKLQTVAHKGLRGLKIAPFYGCQILRPSKLMGFDDPDKPDSLERIIEACGGEAIDYPAKVKCCGFPIIQAREDTALAELIQPIEQAMEAGADAMVTPCPLCHLSLDAWQSKLKKQTGKDFQMPILHLSQLVGVAAGLDRLGAEVQAARRLGAARAREARAVAPRPSHRARATSDPNPRESLSNAGRDRRISPHRSWRTAESAVGSTERGNPHQSLGCRMLVVALLAVGALVVAGYAWFEAGWLRTRVLEVPIDRPARGARRPSHRAPLGLPPRCVAFAGPAGERAVAWVAERKPDLVCVTGDLVSHPRGERSIACARRLARASPSSCSATTTSRSPATRSRARRSSRTSAKPGCSATVRNPSHCAARW